MISVFQGKFFPFTYRVVGILLPVVVMIKIITNTVSEVSLGYYAIALPIGALLIFTEWTLEIHAKEKIIRKNLRFLIFKIGRKQTFTSIERIFINRVKQSYKAFIKLSDGEKLVLDCDVDKEALIERIHIYNRELNTKILDNSIVSNPRWILTETSTL